MNKLLPLLCLLIIASCSKEVPKDQLVERNGVTYEVNSQTPFNGASVNYFENGQLWYKSNYKDGDLHRLYGIYYENGQLKEKGNYKDGELEGLVETYYKNGQLMNKYNYKDGKQDGLQESYGEDGELEDEICYKNDEIVDMSYCEK